MITSRLRPFGTTIFSEMTRLALEHGAVNLSQGFPDFEGPARVIEAAVAALRGGHNQYARSMGLPPLVEAVAAHRARWYGQRFEPSSEVAVTTGATEGIAAAILGLLEPGDEVILFEPFYDSYPAAVALAGCTAKCLTLRFPDFALDVDALRSLVGERTRLLVLNSPHNPSGKVFTRAELEAIAALCVERDLLVLCDEVYEHLTYGAAHVPLATLPGMRERTLTTSSLGKTFSFTGWKIGWLTGPKELVAAAQAAHQFLTFATATPLQIAAAEALRSCDEPFVEGLQGAYRSRRDFLVDTLRAAGFAVSVPAGAYFVLADFSALSREDDRSFAERLVRQVGVAAIPPSCFYAADPAEGRRLLRFAFCKRLETLEAAAERLRVLAG
ncbi:methionine aminotransferase [Vulgatibacter sp.]|uniref:methionine aminotransferase n=1 Tax=Vulgatibacter sp. TaxID=1971226 RepID=UPI00356B04EB